MPLEKSFSEQHRLSKRPQWQKSKSHSGIGKCAQSRTFVPVSDKTKTKLQQFQFQPPAQDAALGGSRASTVTHDDHSSKEPGAAAHTLHEVSSNASASETKRRHADNTKTPLSRLVWQDLVGEIQTPKEEEEISPSERIMWNLDRNTNLTALSPVISRKRRKRARSSSPTSSPSHTIPSTPAVNVKMLAQALKTPHADPALELWDRFAIPQGGKPVSSGLTNPLLAQLMVSSSPRLITDQTIPISGHSLRKSISCGTHWPKRRKVDRHVGQVSSVTFMGSPRANSKTSIVSALLDTVAKEVDEPIAPDEHSVPTVPGEAACDKTFDHLGGKEHDGGEDDVGQGKSDYGDDEFDDKTLMELDVDLKPHESLDSANPPMVGVQGNCSHTGSNRTGQHDEFEELDDDLFEAAEGLMDEATRKHCDGGAQNHRGNNNIRLEGDDCYDDDDDAFGADFDFDAVELAATQSLSHAASSISCPSQKPRSIQRYLVTNVLESSYTDNNGREFSEKILIVEAERTHATRTIHLRGDWLDTPVSVKSFAHIIGKFESNGRCIVDNAQNILILHPDQLISSTVVADSFSCMRRAVLQDRVKATSDSSEPLVYGTIIHEIFQEALMANQWDGQFFATTVDKILAKHVEDLYVIEVSTHTAREHILSKMTEIRHWAQLFVSPVPQPEALVQGRNGEKVNMCVSKLLDVEEHVWSPMYGLKGNIDATVEITMKEGQETRILTVPFEVKTGKNVNSNHQAQTVLYNLLLSDRYDIEVVYGILYYTETSQTLRIPAIRHELRHMIMQRNQLACHVRERSVQLPPMKRSKNVCGKCYAQTACFIYHNLADGGDGETSGMGAKFDEVVKHLDLAHKAFFLKWEDLLTKEERESQKLRRELWTMVSSEREKVGRCFANVVIQEGSASQDLSKPKVFRYQYTFIKEKGSSSFSFLDSQLTAGEPIVVSDEKGHFALALGYVMVVRKHSITVSVDRRLHNARLRQEGFDEVNNQVFTSIMDTALRDESRQKLLGNAEAAPIRYRLDKDEFSSGMATVRNNLVQIMDNASFGSSKIRQLVVDLIPPRYKCVPTQYEIPDVGNLNVDQNKAIEKVMSAKDYALVLGMPGTGKTTTIAHIIRALVSQGKSVLLTSYTHTAVDNILLKLKNDSISILRLGAPAKVHPEVHDFAILASEPMETFEEINKAWQETPVVATTCLGVNHPIFQKRIFDYCIVDEASQITLPICLGPIRMAHTFVLVGDHNQLPPLVQNEEARQGGLDVSLFKLLSDTHPESVVNLEHQYRMCEDIMTLSNTLIYGGRLKCGTEALRHSKLSVPNMAALAQRHFDATTIVSYSQGRTPSQKISFCLAPRPNSCWLRDMLDPEARVRFLNTDTLPGSREEAKGNRIVNAVEARLVVQLVDALVTVGVPPSEIGVMTHYRSQLALLKDGVRFAHPGVEMHTADRFQGRDKEVVVLSLVRSNAACSIGELLRDWRRINVAFTRAKTKLLVVGSRETLRGCGDGEMLARFVELMEERDWVYDLPADALESHFFEDAATTQLTVSSAAEKQLSPATRKRVKGKSRSTRSSPQSSPAGKGNVRHGGEPRKAKISERALLKGKPVLRDILNDMMGGIY